MKLFKLLLPLLICFSLQGVKSLNNNESLENPLKKSTVQKVEKQKTCKKCGHHAKGQLFRHLATHATSVKCSIPNCHSTKSGFTTEECLYHHYKSHHVDNIELDDYWENHVTIDETGMNDYLQLLKTHNLQYIPRAMRAQQIIENYSGLDSEANLEIDEEMKDAAHILVDLMNAKLTTIEPVPVLNNISQVKDRHIDSKN